MALAKKGAYTGGKNAWTLLGPSLLMDLFSVPHLDRWSDRVGDAAANNPPDHRGSKTGSMSALTLVNPVRSRTDLGHGWHPRMRDLLAVGIQALGHVGDCF